MKKLILSAALLAFGSFTAAGQCVNNTLNNLIGTSCTITNLTQSWNLSTFGFVSGAYNGYGANVDATAADIFVTFNTLNNGGALGFSVSFSSAGGANDFFTASTVGQSASWQTYFVANNNQAESAIKQVLHSVENPATMGSGSISVGKRLNNPELGSPLTNILYAGGAGPIGGSNPSTINIPTNTGQVNVIDAYSITSSNVTTGSASLSSYTNSFYAAAAETGVPEPMSFILMGAGLVGIAALRRRNG